MSTTGFAGLYLETRDYQASSTFWSSLGFVPDFETGHGSGQWSHPAGGPYVFLSEHQGEELQTYPILGVADATSFEPQPPLAGLPPFVPQHWGVVEALVPDPDGRLVSLHAPLPAGVIAPDADAHHTQKYGSD